MAKLHFIHAVMNAGKTTQLLQIRHNYAANGENVVLLTNVIDNRNGIGKVSSRIGIEADAIPVGEDDDLFSLVSQIHADTPVAAVLIDEVQFLRPQHIWQAVDIVVKLDIPVMAFGLKVNAFGYLFNNTIATLLAVANKIEEIRQLCHCHSKATMILRYDRNGTVIRTGQVIEVGGDDRYVSVCLRCWVDGDIGPAKRKLLQSLNLAASNILFKEDNHVTNYHCETGEPSNEQRADWARLALDSFAMEVFCGRTFADLEKNGCEDPNEPDGDHYDCLKDLIAYLLHVANNKGWNVDDLLQQARRDFNVDVTKEREPDLAPAQARKLYDGSMPLWNPE